MRSFLRLAAACLSLKICKELCSIVDIGADDVVVQEKDGGHGKAFVAYRCGMDETSDAVEVDTEERRNAEDHIEEDDA
jgi:hypothetical protein